MKTTLLLILVFSCTVLMSQEFIGYGYTIPERQIELAFLQDGIVERILVKEGDRVTEKQILAKLNSEIQELSLRAAVNRARNEGSIRGRMAELEMHRTRLRRLMELGNNQQVREAEIERAKADVAIAEAELLNLQEQKAFYELEVEKNKKELMQFTLQSPIAGIVRKIYREVGENITRVQPQMMQIVDMKQLFVEIYVPIEKTQRIKIGEKFQLDFPQLGLSAVGTLQYMDPLADAASATVRVKILFPNPGEKIPSGTKCVVK